LQLTKGFGKNRVRDILAMMKRGKLEGELGDEIRDFFDDLISNEARVRWTGYLRGDENYPVDIMEFETVYFVSAEGEETGYFIDIKQAKSFISLNWFGEVGDEVQEDRDSEGED
jgi:hypothetical protein